MIVCSRGVAQITLFEFVYRNYFSRRGPQPTASGRMGDVTVECGLDSPCRVDEISKTVVVDLLSSSRIDDRSMMPRRLITFQRGDRDSSSRAVYLARTRSNK